MLELNQDDEPQQYFNLCRKLSKEVYNDCLVLDFRDKMANRWEKVYTLLKENEKEKPYIDGNFQCSAYKNENIIIIAFRGTDIDEIADFLADTSFLVHKTPYFSTDSAEKYYNAVKKDYPDCKIILTGHSLGGGYAQIISYLAVKEDDSSLLGAITFNAPGVGYLVKKDKEDGIKNILKKIVSNYVIMNDYVGNFQSHIGDTYYFQPYALNKYGVNEQGEKERITAHGCILNYNLKEFGPRYKHPEEFGTKNAWALWIYDVNNTNPSENLIRITLDNVMRVKTQDLEKAMGIINSSDIKLINSFHYKTDVETYDLLSYEENCRIDALIQAQKNQRKINA